MLRSLRGRTLLTILPVLFATFAGLSGFLAIRAHGAEADALEEQLHSEALGIAGVVRAIGSHGPLELGRLIDEVVVSGTEVIVVNSSGDIWYASPGMTGSRALESPEVKEAFMGGVGKGVRLDALTGDSELHLAAPVFEDGLVMAVVRVTAPRSSLGAAVAAVLWPTLFAGLVAVILIGGLGLLLWLPLSRTMTRLSGLAERLSAGKLHERARFSLVPEAEALAGAIDNMAASLEIRVRESLEQRDAFGAVIDAMADGLLVANQQGIVELLNPAASQIFALAPIEAVGMSFMEAVRDHELEDIFHKTLSAGHTQVRELNFGGEMRSLKVTAAPIEWKGGPSVLIMVQDLTAIHKLEAVRQEFVTNVSHELRTPLASIRASVEVLQSGAMTKKADADEFLQRLIREIDELTDLVQSLLDLSRVESGKAGLALRPVVIQEAIQEAIDRLAPQSAKQKLSIRMDVTAELPLALADKESLGEIVRNLLGNAIKFTPESGNILVSAHQAEGMIELMVADDGVGIQQEHLPHIFERFYKADRSRSSDGVGLGLAIAKHLVQAHGGNIWAVSDAGEGSTFHFTVPVVPTMGGVPTA